MTFTVTNLQIGSTDTTLNASGLSGGDAVITNLQLTGGENFTLNGANVSVGQLVINGGTISSGNFANLIYGGITYTTSTDIKLDSSGGTFDTGTGNMTVSRVLTGPGTLTRSGIGTLILTGTNTYTGDTNINNGTPELTSAGSLTIM